MSDVPGIRCREGAIERRDAGRVTLIRRPRRAWRSVRRAERIVDCRGRAARTVGRFPDPQTKVRRTWAGGNRQVRFERHPGVRSDTRVARCSDRALGEDPVGHPVNQCNPEIPLVRGLAAHVDRVADLETPRRLLDEDGSALIEVEPAGCRPKGIGPFVALYHGDRLAFLEEHDTVDRRKLGEGVHDLGLSVDCRRDVVDGIEGAREIDRRDAALDVDVEQRRLIPAAPSRVARAHHVAPRCRPTARRRSVQPAARGSRQRLRRSLGGRHDEPGRGTRAPSRRASGSRR